MAQRLLFLLLAISFVLVKGKYKGISDRPKCAQTTSDANLPSTPKLIAIRDLMSTERLGAYIIPSIDQHGSEYIGPSDKRRQWISAFTGSAGKALITADKAILWTDGRYALQAEMQLDCHWSILETSPTIDDWIVANLKDVKVGADPRFFSKSEWRFAAEDFMDVNLTLIPVLSLIDRVWKEPRRPARFR